MSRGFYLKLGFGNLKKNRGLYLPFILAGIGITAVLYIVISIYLNDGINQMPGAYDMQMILDLGTTVITVFGFIFLFYTNSFLIKNRKKELGLYGILGMEKRHIARVLFWETLMTMIVILAVGVAAGILFSRLMFLVLLNLLELETNFKFTVSLQAALGVIYRFAPLFLLILLANLLQIRIVSPIQLLMGGQYGEKEPRTKWLLTILGVLCLGAGYGIAVSIEVPLEALNWFFIAVILVIIGTYCFFTAGSIALLKMLKKRKKFFYQPNHFIAVSGMIYRMKQNAVGLANICILSTMVLVTLSTTICLYIGKEDLLKGRYPHDVVVSHSSAGHSEAELQELIQKVSEEYHVQAGAGYHHKQVFFVANVKGSRFEFVSARNTTISDAYSVTVLLLSDYNKLNGAAETLKEDEVLVYSSASPYDHAELYFSDYAFKVKGTIKNNPLADSNTDMLLHNYMIVMKDEAAVQRIGSAIGYDPAKGMTFMTTFDLVGGEEAGLAFTNRLRDQMNTVYEDYMVDSLYLIKDGMDVATGGFLFIGILLGALFTMAAVLIIYYKQISEGNDDQVRFETMQKVGMSQKEVKKAIRSQILMVFYLPLLVAVLHVVFAFRVIMKLLEIFYLTNVPLFVICTVITILVYALAYFMVYSLTAKKYYQLVRMQGMR